MTANHARIDVHHHILPPDYVRLIGRDAIGRPAPCGVMPDWDVGTSLRVMDEGGIRSAVVSVSAPGVWQGDLGLAQRAARICNEFAAQMSADYPGRFGSLATLPLPDIKAALAELDFAVDVLKSDGIVLMTNYDGLYLGDPLFTPLFQECNRRRLIVYVHPTSCVHDMEVLPGIPAAMLEFPHDTTRSIVSLLNAGVFARFPDIRFIFSHAGGTLPFLLGRIAAMSTIIGKPGWVPQLHKLYFDTASAANPSAFQPLLRMTTVKQILLGTDFPFVPEAGVKATLDGLHRLGLNTDELQDIETNNARRLFSRFA
jgi:predicted TIM-barrel fold metal-dependent hydrolase